MSEHPLIVTVADIESRIFLLRGQKVMLSMDLADLYEVAPKILMQAFKRNLERFPADFMFQLTLQEFANLKSQIVTSSWGGMCIRRLNETATVQEREQRHVSKDHLRAFLMVSLSG